MNAGHKDEEEGIRGADFFRVDHRSVLKHFQIQEDPSANYERGKDGKQKGSGAASINLQLVHSCNTFPEGPALDNMVNIHKYPLHLTRN